MKLSAVAVILLLICALAIPAGAQAPPDGLRVQRIGGADRYETAVLTVIERHYPLSDIIIVNGESWPDGLVAGALLAGGPRVVVPVQRDVIPTAVRDYFTGSLAVTRQYTIVGGEAAVSPAVEQELAELIPGAPIRRLGGRDRFETARSVADLYIRERGAQSQPVDERQFGVILVRADSFADAIPAPNISLTRRAPILLASTRAEFGADNAAWLSGHAGRIDSITALGTSEVLADSVIDQAVAAVSGPAD